MNREKMGQAIRKIIEDRRAASFGERVEVYSAARASLRKATNDEPAIMAELDQVIDEVEASHAKGQETETGGGRRPGGARRLLSGLVAGAILGGAATAATMTFGFHFKPESAVAATLMRQYNQAAPLVPVAVDYLHKVADSVVEMQKNDPAALEAKASKYTSVAALDPGLWKMFPRSMPPGSSVIIRADRNDYKVLFTWTLCGAVRFERPEMVDLVRARADVIGCPYFGLWSQGAAKW
ncbi:MAG: hypothetical protein ACTHLP_04480 [Rhizobiaceae bacterium]